MALHISPAASAEPPPILATGRPVNEGKLDQLAQQTYAYLIKFLGRDDGRKVWYAGQRIMDLEERARFYAHVVMETERMLGSEITGPPLGDYALYREQPVDVRTFLCDSYFLNKGAEIYPSVMDELVELNSGKYVEAVLTGGIGSGKTTTALYTNAYQLYLLSCMRSAHRTFDLDPSSEILLIFQSINAKLAKSLDFARFKSMLEGSPYFLEKFPFKKDVESKLVFPNRIEVVPVSGAETAAIGQNVIGGLIDELNYMAVIEKSKQSSDKGTYDQAVALYNSIARRRKSRFLKAGKMPGILCLVSSKKYPGQFTDRKQEEAKTDSTIFVYDKRIWDIKPDAFTSGWFHVFIGDDTRKPRILQDTEEVADADRELVMAIPEDFRNDFVIDITNALREIAGVSTLARHPYFVETERVNESMGHHLSIFSRDEVDFVTQKVGVRKDQIVDPDQPRFAHIDLAISGDSAGVCVGYVNGFVSMKDLGMGDEVGLMPTFHIDGVLRVVPPKGSEILFWKIREVLIGLRDKLKLNLRWITYDSFESTDSQQLLRQQGFITGYQSVDIVPPANPSGTSEARRRQPYDYLKGAVYTGRVKMPKHAKLQKELVMLERDLKTGKIDHPPAGSKDCADALAGVVYGLTMRREIWSLFGIPLVQMPSSVATTVDRLAEKDAKERAALERIEGLSEVERVTMRIRR